MEAIIESWGREHYPRLMDNPQVIEELYRKRVLNQPSRLQAVAYPLTRVAALKSNDSATLLVTKIESSVVKMDLCKQCNRKTCVEGGHGPERIPFFIVTLKAADETGMGKFKRLGSDPMTYEVVEQNEEFLVSGVMKHSEKWGDEFDMKTVIPLTKEQLAAWDSMEQYMSIHGGEAGISEEEFTRITAGKEKLLAPFFEHVFIGHNNGRIKW